MITASAKRVSLLRVTSAEFTARTTGLKLCTLYCYIYFFLVVEKFNKRVTLATDKAISPGISLCTILSLRNSDGEGDITKKTILQNMKF